MIKEKEYTIRQIAELGLKKYKINPDEVGRETLIDSIRKQIEKIIKQVGIESVGVGKSTPASKRLAKTYSKETKDTLLYD